MRRLLGLPALLLLAACSRADAILVRQADFAEPDPTTAAADSAAVRALLPVRGHRIGAGAGAVLGFRWYSSGKPWNMRDGRFRKVTVVVPDSLLARSGRYALGPGSPVRLRYSVGSSMRPEQACLGGARGGHLRVWKGMFRSVRVEVELDVAAVHPDGTPCRAEHFRKRFTPHRVRPDGLTPWLGRPGTTVIQETAP